jgi:CRP-like cAMP-binding protein
MLTIIEKVLLLQNVDIFSAVATEQLAFLAAIAQEVNAEKNQVLYRENDRPDGLFIVVTGTVRVLRGGAEIGRFGPNHALGIWVLFDDQPRLATVETTEETSLLFIGRDDFYDVLAEHTEIVQELFKRLVRRLHRLADGIDPKLWQPAF